jgi:MOSC domain-containing protein YiiM
VEVACVNCGLNPSEVGNLCRPCYQYQYRHGKPRPKGQWAGFTVEETLRGFERLARMLARGGIRVGDEDVSTPR